MGRFSAVHTIGRGLQEAPVLRQGLGVTWMLAAVGACGRVVVPVGHLVFDVGLPVALREQHLPIPDDRHCGAGDLLPLDL